MSEPDYRAALVEYVREQALPPDKFSHQARLYRLAGSLGRGGHYDDDVLFAAAWLHDMGVFIGHRPESVEALAAWDHIAYAIKVTPAILQSVGFPAGKIPAVLGVIKTHMPSSEPDCIEGVLLRDADILEQLGAVGILRTVSKVGRDSRFVRFDDALKVLRWNLEQLPSLLKLQSSREEAAKRVEVLRQFLEAAIDEAGSTPW